MGVSDEQKRLAERSSCRASVTLRRCEGLAGHQRRARRALRFKFSDPTLQSSCSPRAARLVEHTKNDDYWGDGGDGGGRNRPASCSWSFGHGMVRSVDNTGFGWFWGFLSLLLLRA